MRLCNISVYFSDNIIVQKDCLFSQELEIYKGNLFLGSYADFHCPETFISLWCKEHSGFGDIICMEFTYNNGFSALVEYEFDDYVSVTFFNNERVVFNGIHSNDVRTLLTHIGLLVNSFSSDEYRRSAI